MMTLTFLISAGCINSVVNLKEITLTGTVQQSDPSVTTDGKLYLTVLREWRGEGDLRYPMLPVTSIEVDGLGLYEWTFNINIDRDEGLALYGWLDSDQDGIFCSLDGDVERSGLTVLGSGPLDYVMNADLTLDSECIGVERLYSMQTVNDSGEQ